MERHSKQKYYFLILVLLLWVVFPTEQALVHGASKGKIVGKVTDAQTGEPLPGVNIVVEGTMLGAATGANGEYFIINFPPGSYNIRASMIGYSAMTVTGVIVNINQTTTENFTLTQQAIQGETVVVVADRDIVKTDVANTQKILSGEEMAAIPVAQFHDILDKQAGITKFDSRGLFIRGSREASISLTLDGVETRDNVDNQVYTRINPDEVEQVEVQTGGFNAEYGNASAGVITVVSKEGGDTYSGTFDGRYGIPHRKHFGPPLKDWYDQYFERSEYWTEQAANIQVGSAYEGFKDRPELLRELYRWRMRDEFTQYGDKPDTYLTATFGGPVPFLKNTTFFTSGRSEKTYYLYNGATDFYTDKGLMGKITSHITPGLKLNFTYRYTESVGVNRYDREYIMENIGMVDGTSQTETMSNHERRFLYNSVEQVAYSGMGGWPYTNKMSISKRIRNMFGFTLTHALSSRTFYEINLLYSDYRISGKPLAVRDTTATHTLVDPADPTYELTLSGPYAMAPELNWPFALSDPYGMEIGATYGNFENSRDRNLSLRAVITSQINMKNQINGGIQFTYTDLFKDEQRRSSDGKPYDWDWHVFPKHLAIWVSDKLEFEGMVANIGLRADCRIPHHRWYDTVHYPYDYHWSDYFQAGDSTATGPHYKPPVRWALAPRLGISHPIGAAAKIYFNYDHYYQEPPLERQYYFQRRYDAYSYWTFGNPELPFHKTVQYEIGYEQNIMDMFRVAISGFYKDNTNLVNDNIQYSGIPDMIGDQRYQVNYSSFNANYYQSARGLQLTVEKRVGRFWTGWFNFDYEIYSRGILGFGTFFEDSTRTSRAYDYSSVNRNIVPMPRFNLGINLHTPSQFGPRLGGFFPLAGLNLNFLFWWRSQPTFTYDPARLSTPYDPRDNKRWKPHHATNLVFTKRIPLSFGLTPIFYVEIYNLFNTKNMFRRAFTDAELRDYCALLEEHGGSPGEREDLAREALLNRPDSGPGNTPYDLYLNPREVWLGFRVEFR